MQQWNSISASVQDEDKIYVILRDLCWRISNRAWNVL